MIDELQAAFGDQYTLEHELTGGGMSRVFVALDPRLHRRVVLKLVPRELIGGASTERFQREIMLSARLQHPHIVPVLDAGEILGLPYFVMPFIEGESLRTRLGRGPLSVRETAAVLRDVARALAFAHENGVAHRDIKPDNILLSAGSAVVTDFGVAKAFGVVGSRGNRVRSATVTAAGVSIGTPAYMSPEQAAADPDIDPRTDLYSLGVVAYEMLVGAPPFHARTPQATLAAHISEIPRPLATLRYDVPVGLAELIMRLLAKERDKRPRSAAEVVRFLESAAAVTGDVARPEIVKKRRPWTALLVAAGIVVLLALGGAVAMLVKTQRKVERAPTIATSNAVVVDPFEIAGDTSAATPIARAINAEIVSALTPISAVRVASADAPIRANESRVHAMVQAEARTVRVYVRLLDSTGAIVWSQRFVGASTGGFAVQDSVRDAVVNAVAARRP